MDMIPLRSSLVIEAGYDGDARKLTIRLEDERRRIYMYYLVPESVFRELIESESPGRYFNREIRDVYPYRRAIPS